MGLYLLVAFLLGAFHALEPGHGKSLVAAYLVGRRASLKHALVLGVTAAFTHTFSVFLIALTSLILLNKLNHDILFHCMTLLSGFLLLVFAGYSFLKSRNAHTHPHPRMPHNLESFKNLLLVGVSAGLLPCPGALAVLLASLAMRKLILGIMLVSAYSAGVGFALVSISCAAVLASSAVQRLSPNTWLMRLPGLSAGLVFVLAIILGVREAAHLLTNHLL